MTVTPSEENGRMDSDTLAQIAFDSVPPEYWCDWGEEESLQRQAEQWVLEHGLEPSAF